MPRDVIAHRPGTLLGLMNVGLGGVLLLGAASRTSAFSFATAKELAPVEVWGLGFLLVGLVLIGAVRAPRAGVLACIVGGGLHTFWAVAFLTAALMDTRAALTGIPVYTFVATVHLLTAMRLSTIGPTTRQVG